MRHPGARLPAAALRRLRPRQAAGLQLQTARVLPLMWCPAHVADRRPPGGSRHRRMCQCASGCSRCRSRCVCCWPRSPSWSRRCCRVSVPRTHLAPLVAIVLFGGAVFSRGRHRGDRGWGDRRSGVIRRPPVVRQQQLEVAVLQRGQALEHVLEIGPGIVPVEFG